MTTRHILHDTGHCLRAAAPPLLALSVLALAGTTQGEAPAPGGVAEVVLVAWRAAVLGTVLWFLVAVVWAASRPLRDRRAFQRLLHLREIAAVPDRVLVHVQTIVWSSTAGQLAVVVNVATGVASRVWLPETTVPNGSYVVLERADNGVQVIDQMGAHSVEAAHRSEGRCHHVRETASDPTPTPHGREESDAVTLIAEVEEYLKKR